MKIINDLNDKDIITFNAVGDVETNDDNRVKIRI